MDPKCGFRVNVSDREGQAQAVAATGIFSVVAHLPIGELLLVKRGLESDGWRRGDDGANLDNGNPGLAPLD